MSVITASGSGGNEFGQKEIENLWGKGPIFVGAYQSIAWFYAATTGPDRDQVRDEGAVRRRLPGGRRRARGALALAPERSGAASTSSSRGGTEAPIGPYALTCQLTNGRLSLENDAGRRLPPVRRARERLRPGRGRRDRDRRGGWTCEEARGAAGLRARSPATARRTTPSTPSTASGDGSQLARAMQMALERRGRGHGRRRRRVRRRRRRARGGPRGGLRDQGGLRRATCPVTAPKTMTGRLYGGGAPLDVAAAVFAMRDGVIPPTINLDSPAEGCDLAFVTGGEGGAGRHRARERARLRRVQQLDRPAQAVIASLLEEAPADRPALSAGDRVLTYAELRELSARLEEQLGAAGDLRGQRVAFVAPNSPELVAGLFAAWRLGAVAVPLSSRLRERELELMLADAEPVVVVSVAAHGGYSFADVLPRILPPSVRRCLLGADEVGIRRGDVRARTRSRSEIAAILYTSGTTGIPKGVLVKHVREVEGSRFLADTLRLDGGRSLWGDRSDLACVRAHLVARSGGRGGRGRSSSTRASRPRRCCARSRRATPPCCTAHRRSSAPCSRRGRTGFPASAPGSSPERRARSDLLEALDERGTRILNCYGLSETGAVTCVRLDDPPVQRHETVGRASPAVRGARDRRRARSARRAPHARLLPPAGRDGRRPSATAGSVPATWPRSTTATSASSAGRRRSSTSAASTSFPPRSRRRCSRIPTSRTPRCSAFRTSGWARRSPPTSRRGRAPSSSATDLIAFARSRIAGYKVPYAIEILPELPLLPSGKPDRKALSR